MEPLIKGVKFSKDCNELYDVLKTIKDKYPDSIPMPNRGGDGNMVYTLEI